MHCLDLSKNWFAKISVKSLDPRQVYRIFSILQRNYLVVKELLVEKKSA